MTGSNGHILTQPDRSPLLVWMSVSCRHTQSSSSTKLESAPAGEGWWGTGVWARLRAGGELRLCPFLCKGKTSCCVVLCHAGVGEG
jgi:hypothetical protein